MIKIITLRGLNNQSFSINLQSKIYRRILL